MSVCVCVCAGVARYMKLTHIRLKVMEYDSECMGGRDGKGDGMAGMVMGEWDGG